MESEESKIESEGAELGSDAAPSWDNIPEDTARVILHQAETFMASQLQVALAADQRAVTAASVFIALATAILAATLAYWAGTNDLPILIGGILTTALLCISAFAGFWAARPILFYFPGNHPANWWRCATYALSLSIGGELENYQERIQHNEGCLQANARILSRGARLAAAAPLVGLVGWAATSFFWIPRP